MINVVDGRSCEPDWFDTAFGRDGLVALELGCGRGEYTLALARSRPDRGVLGVDRNGGRLWKGARLALDERLTNAFFLRSPIELLEDHVPPGRIDEIWLPFPDPLSKHRQASRRLTSMLFLVRYRRLMAPGGFIRLKTDDSHLVTFAERAVRDAGGRVLEASAGPVGADGTVTAVRTTYEERYRREGRTIHEREFRFD